MWVFGKDVKGQDVYIKISIGINNASAICISFHIAEHDIKYKFIHESPKYNASAKQDSIRFLDGWLVYDTSLLRNSLLMNGLAAV